MKFKSLKKDKQGNVMILILAVVMCVMLPVIAVIYDIGQMRMYQQDVKNAQEIAGLSCIGVAGGSVEGNSSQGAGGFSESKCRPSAIVTAWANLGIQANGAAQTNIQTTSWFKQLQNTRTNGRLVQCKGEKANVDVKKEGNHFEVQIKGLCYRPMFIKPSVLNFQMLKNNPYRINVQFADEYHVEVRPSYFSAVYDKKN